MTHSDVQAIGWIITRDACVDIGRAMLGGRRRIVPAQMRAVGGRWRALQNVLHEHYWQHSPFRCAALRIPLAPAAEQAVVAFVAMLTATWPERYSAMTLRRRLRDGLWLAAIGLSLATALTGGAVGGELVPILLVMALWNMICSLQVLRLYGIVRQVDVRKAADGRSVEPTPSAQPHTQVIERPESER